ncbi:MAG: XrtA/PEP-CTERM system histidine kinase PrsK [Sphingobium sp.]
MSVMFQLVGDGGHALAAALFAALAIYIMRGSGATIERNLLCAAVAFTALWALYTAFGSVTRPISGLSENLRNGAWLLFMFVMLRRGEGRRSGHPVSITWIYALLGGVLVLQTTADLLPPAIIADSFHSVVMFSLSLRMMFAAGALVLVHNLFTISAPEGRARIALVMAALVAMWTYDLNLYSLAVLSRGNAGELYALRGVGMAALALVIGVGVRGGGEWRLRVSRTVAFRSFSLVAVGLYIVGIAIVVSAVEWLGGSHARMIGIGSLFAMLVAALVLLPSPRFHSLVKVQISKHFFQHRYDYRAEWMRFTDTVGAPEGDGPPLNERVVKALADITESASGLLLLPAEGGTLAVDCVWNWPGLSASLSQLSARDAAALKESGWIMGLDEMRASARHIDARWMLADQSAWALVPLIHFNRLAGAILLGRPRIHRKLDWEDYDMLRAAGRQVASYISEALGHQALEEARRFDEFNRRFAFIMHDIKNLVSQLSLLSSNAERHADNPAFRADMVLTLREAVSKMNDLLARLSQHNKAPPAEARSVDVGPIIHAVVATRSRQHKIEVRGHAPKAAVDPQRLEQILAHLLQNAIDASAQGQPVVIEFGRTDEAVTIAVADKGCGMTADFIRRDLFKPFVSSKPGGFGIGAFEARALAHSMGGSITVESTPGEGSRFTVFLPIGDQPTAAIMQERAA